MFPDRLLRVVQLLSKLPGVGEKTAQRYALALLVGEESVARELGRALGEMRDHVGACSQCGHVADVVPGRQPLCTICADNRRDPSILCVVARVQDLLSVERSGAMRGRYHVLGKLLSPLDGVSRDDLGIDRLIARIEAGEGAIREILVATPPSVDGEATALLLSREIGALCIRREGVRGESIHVTRIASGVPHGGDLEFADQITIGRAIEHRRRFG